MKPTPEEIGNLLALKRHERPPEGYMEDFLHEFHQRRRRETVERAESLPWWKRVGEWFGDQGLAKWAYGAGLAYAAAMAVALMVPQSNPAESPAPQPVHRTIESPSQLEELDLRSDAEGELGEVEF